MYSGTKNAHIQMDIRTNEYTDEMSATTEADSNTLTHQCLFSAIPKEFTHNKYDCVAANFINKLKYLLTIVNSNDQQFK